jgi:hypothetical protein
MFYTYMLIDPRNNEPFYVGKGSKRRMYDHTTEAKKHPSKWTNSYKCGRLIEIHNSGRSLKYHTEVFENEQHAYKREHELIEQYGRICDGSGTLTNIQVGGSGCSNEPCWKSVDVYDLESNFIETFPSQRSAARFIGCSPATLNHFIKGKSQQAKGYLIVPEGSPPPVYQPTRGRSVVAYNLDGSVVGEYPSIQQCAEVLNLPTGSTAPVSTCLNMKHEIRNTKRVGNYMFSHPGEIIEAYSDPMFRSIEIEEPSGNKICFTSILEAADFLKIKPCTVVSNAKGRTHKLVTGHACRYL